MPSYRVFGGLLDSEIAFDGLCPTEGGNADWTFRVDDSARGWHELEQLGREQVSDELEITLSRDRDGGVVLRYSAYDLGAFRISPDGTDIRWRPGEQPWMAPLRWILMGRVMATAMYVGGTLCLHGSAVARDGGAVCFIAPKRHGKSTLAAALVAGGCRLVADDVVPVHPGPPITISPGVPVLRLHRDSEEAVALSGVAESNDDALGKARIDFAAEGDDRAGGLTLQGIYVLEPVMTEPEPGCVVVRERIFGVDALHALVRHTSIAPLLAAAEAGLLLSHASAVIRSVPIYKLRAIRDLQRLPEVVEKLSRWQVEERSLV